VEKNEHAGEQIPPPVGSTPRGWVSNPKGLRPLMKRVFINLKAKLLLLCLSFTLLSLAFIYFFSIKVYSDTISNMESILLDYKINHTVTNLSDSILDFKNMIAKIITDKDMIELFRRFDRMHVNTPNEGKDDLLLAAFIQSQLMENFSNFSSMNANIASLAIISNSGEMILYSRLNSETYRHLKIASREYNEAFLKYSGEEFIEDVNIIQAVTLPGAPGNVNQYVYFTYPAVELIEKEVFGVLVMEVDAKALTVNSANEPGISIIDTYINQDSCITESNGTIVASQNNENIGRNISTLHPRSGFLIHTREIRNSDLSLTLIFERMVLRQIINRFRTVLVISIIIIMTIFFIIVVLVIDRLMIQSKKIVQAINQFRKTKKETKLSIDQNDDFLFAIADQFERMSAEIEALFLELKQKNERIRLAKDRQRHAEIQALQAQINPHFIYNALDRINWVALENDQNTISRMLNELGYLLRYSISNIDSLVPLKDELEWMEKYVSIQSERFEKKITLIKNIEQDTLDFPIYKMLLQPLVENSIFHGFSAAIDYPEIVINAGVSEKRKLNISLADNGWGMNDEKLRYVKRICRRENQENLSNIGISNVANRMWYYYGEESMIDVTSSTERGTKFILTIPFVRQGD
jgi:sensor histidine kinase YesM